MRANQTNRFDSSLRHHVVSRGTMLSPFRAHQADPQDTGGGRDVRERGRLTKYTDQLFLAHKIEVPSCVKPPWLTSEIKHTKS